VDELLFQRPEALVDRGQLARRTEPSNSPCARFRCWSTSRLRPDRRASRALARDLRLQQHVLPPHRDVLGPQDVLLGLVEAADSRARMPSSFVA
jgi:hypothetical protein